MSIFGCSDLPQAGVHNVFMLWTISHTLLGPNLRLPWLESYACRILSILSRTICTARSVRPRAPVLANALLGIFLTVLMLTPSSRALSLLLAPVATQSAIWRSRRLSESYIILVPLVTRLFHPDWLGLFADCHNLMTNAGGRHRQSRRRATTLPVERYRKRSS